MLKCMAVSPGPDVVTELYDEACVSEIEFNIERSLTFVCWKKITFGMVHAICELRADKARSTNFV